MRYDLRKHILKAVYGLPSEEVTSWVEIHEEAASTKLSWETASMWTPAQRNAVATAIMEWSMEVGMHDASVDLQGYNERLALWPLTAVVQRVTQLPEANGEAYAHVIGMVRHMCQHGRWGDASEETGLIETAQHLTEKVRLATSVREKDICHAVRGLISATQGNTAGYRFALSAALDAITHELYVFNAGGARELRGIYAKAIPDAVDIVAGIKVY